MSNQKILIISWTVHPWPTGSSVIVNNIVENMSKNDVVVVGEKHPHLTSSWSPELPKIYYINPNVSIRGRGQTHLRWLKFFAMLRQVKSIAKKENVKTILAIFPDDFYLFLAYRLSHSLNIPIFTWFHNTYLDNYTGYRKIFARIFQPIIFKRAEKTFVMSDGMKNFYNEKYPKIDFITLNHGFKLPKLNFKSNDLKSKKYNDKIKFLYTGSLNDSCRDASERLFRAILSDHRYEIHVFSGNPIEDFMKYGERNQQIKFHGFVTQEQLYKNISDYDIMLLPHGLTGNRTDVEFKTIFPTRTIPLLISGKPILVHSPENTYLTDFFQENDCGWLVTTPDEGEILTTISRICTEQDKVDIKISNALKAAEHYKVEKVLNQLMSALAH